MEEIYLNQIAPSSRILTTLLIRVAVFSLVDLTAKVAIICFHDRIIELKLRRTTDTPASTSSLLYQILKKKKELQSYQNINSAIPGSPSKIHNYFDSQSQPPPK